MPSNKVRRQSQRVERIIHTLQALCSLYHPLSFFRPDNKTNDTKEKRQSVATGPRQQLAMELRRLRTRRRPRFSCFSWPDTSSGPAGFDSSRKKKMGRSTWFRHNRRIPIPRIDVHWGFYGASLRVRALSYCRQDRRAARVPPGRHWRAAAGSHWTAPGRPLGQMCTKPRPPAVPRIGGYPPPASQDPQASTAANPLDGVQATAWTPSFTGGSRLVQRLGWLDWLAQAAPHSRGSSGGPVAQCLFQRFRSRSLSSSKGPRAASRLETLLPTARHGLAFALAWADVLDLAVCVFYFIFNLGR